MGLADVRAAIIEYLTVNPDGQVPFLNKVFGFPAKFTPEGEIYPQDSPGVQSGAVIYLYIGRATDDRVAFGGPHSGRKFRVYEVTLHCLLFSQKPLSQDAGEDNETFLDGLVTAIRADRTCGTGVAPASPHGDGSGIIDQWGEGGLNGGKDIR